MFCRFRGGVNSIPKLLTVRKVTRVNFACQCHYHNECFPPYSFISDFS